MTVFSFAEVGAPLSCRRMVPPMIDTIRSGWSVDMSMLVLVHLIMFMKCVMSSMYWMYCTAYIVYIDS